MLYKKSFLPPGHPYLLTVRFLVGLTNKRIKSKKFCPSHPAYCMSLQIQSSAILMLIS
uniref:Uncharacterized protein n=1 Tax=Utricularia reniformis TaxID=192314 RepID=A0A1Y0B1F8_9LAMI|nr:hypothetical protein AEK19_MT0989 [Utricularia reniformis]ART31214.1 hypothetical protein AEK19_MT0989 [Utricularia reniformis]